MEYDCEQRKYMQYACCHSLSLYLHIVHLMPYECRILVGPPRVGVQQDSEQAPGKHVMSTTMWGRSLKNPHFLLGREFALNVERRQ